MCYTSVSRIVKRITRSIVSSLSFFFFFSFSLYNPGMEILSATLNLREERYRRFEDELFLSVGTRWRKRWLLFWEDREECTLSTPLSAQRNQRRFYGVSMAPPTESIHPAPHFLIAVCKRRFPRSRSPRTKFAAARLKTIPRKSSLDKRDGASSHRNDLHAASARRFFRAAHGTVKVR